MVNEAERAASGLGALASGFGAAWSFSAQAVELVFGLPVQVVLACFFASAAARTYVGTVGLVRTAWVIMACAMVGAYTLPLAMHLLGLPTGVQAGVGVVISGGMQFPAVRGWAVDVAKGWFSKKPSPPGGSSEER